MALPLYPSLKEDLEDLLMEMAATRHVMNWGLSRSRRVSYNTRDRGMSTIL
jgi:hypothetical protein